MAALVAAFFMPATAQAAGCPSLHTHNQIAKRALSVSVGGHGGDFHGHQPTSRQLQRLGAIRSCLKRSDRAQYRAARRVWRARAQTNRYYRHLDAITACGEWVACGIVEHESATSGYYRAYNPPATGCSGHGCVGAYQIDAQWFGRSCSRWAGAMWTPAAQHECAYVILQVQGMAAWGM